MWYNINMGKIIEFKSKSDNLIDFIEENIEIFKERKIDNILIACKDKNTNEVLTGHFNLDAGDKQELLGHIQIDIIDEYIRNNYT